jgi:inosine-uridine nucleoside N-ribohydrolase
LPAADAPAPAARIWIDADAACGHSPRTDPDDCLALLVLAERASARIVGVSAVGGNAPLEVTQQTTRSLAGQLGLPFREPAELAEALRQGPLTLIALGPLTNIARALQASPELGRHIERLVAVMGRRPGHLFHPAEGAGGGMLLGHGPVFSDFNFAQDPEATAIILRFGFPLTLIPYDAARHVEIGAAELERLGTRGGAHAWVAQRSRGWLKFWNDDIGRAGFYPFDLLAAAYVLDPRGFECAQVLAGIGSDLLFLAPWRDRALLVTQQPEDLEDAAPRRPAVYCHRLRPGKALAGILWP